MRIIEAPPLHPPQTNNILVFFVFLCSLEKHYDASLFFFLFSPLNILRYDSKTCPSRLTNLTLPSMNCFLSLGRSSEFFETAKTERRKILRQKDVSFYLINTIHKKKRRLPGTTCLTAYRHLITQAYRRR